MIQAGYRRADLTWIFFIQAVVCAISQNQGNLSARIQWKNLDQLPGKIRWYNFFLTLGVLGTILLLMLFRGKLAEGTAQLFAGLKWAGRQLLLQLVSLVNQSGAAAAAPPTTYQPPDWSGMNPFTGRGDSWWDEIGLLILAAVLIWYRREILEKIRTAWKNIKEGTGRILFRIPVFERRRSHRAEAAYTDWTEFLPASQTEGKKDETFRHRNWRKQVRAFCQTQHPLDAAGYRKGYQLGLQWLQQQGVRIESADTPQEILQKIEKNSAGQWETVTWQYEKVRYGEASQLEPESAEALLESLRQMDRLH